jgi:NADPH:quinone reductase-like Zn-dependent oxidoreductase
MFKREFKNFETQIERVRACSVNTVDTKVHRGVYGDYPTTTNASHVSYQIIGFDGAGAIWDVERTYHRSCSGVGGLSYVRLYSEYGQR